MARGNFGNPEQHSAAGKKGAKAQPTEAKAKGGSRSGGNFKNDPQRASEAGKMGGSK